VNLEVRDLSNILVGTRGVNLSTIADGGVVSVNTVSVTPGVAVPICGQTFTFCLNKLIEDNNTCTVGTPLDQLKCINANEAAWKVCSAACPQ
jgi:hypothetical protein